MEIIVTRTRAQEESLFTNSIRHPNHGIQLTEIYVVNPSCDRAFGRIVKSTKEEEMVVSCFGDSGDGVIYHYERQCTGKAYVLRQSIEFDTNI